MFSSKKAWTFGQIQELITAVKKHPCLYDRRNATYNQTKPKEVLYMRLARMCFEFVANFGFCVICRTPGTV